MSQISEYVDPELLFDSARQCWANFEHLIQILPRDHQHTITAHDAQGRFSVWRQDLEGLQDELLWNSTDERKQDAHNAIYDTLLNLNSALNDVGSILSEEQPGSQEDDLMSLLGDEEQADPENAELVAFLSSPTTRVDELFLSIWSHIDRLFKLASWLRREIRHESSSLATIPVPAPGDDFIYDYHMCRLQRKYPKLSQQPRLCKTLGQALLFRRALILRKSKTKDRHTPEITPQLELRSLPTLLSGNESKSKSPAPSMTPKESTAINISATEKDTTPTYDTDTGTERVVFEEDNGGLEVADLTTFVIDGIPLQFGKPFQCPFCGVIKSIGTRSEWRQHVSEDLKPYVCTSQQCGSGLFASRREWFSHELEFHRSTWKCQPCHVRFLSRSTLMQHLNTKHQSQNLKTSNILAMVQTKRDSSTRSCPLCDEWTTQETERDSTSFCQHLGRHLQQIALEAIPPLKGMEAIPLISPRLLDQSAILRLQPVQEVEADMRLLGIDHPDTLKSMTRLVWQLTDSEEYSAAEPLALKTFEMSKQVLGEDHRETLYRMYTLAEVYRRTHDTKHESESLALQGLGAAKRVHGENDLSVAYFLSVLGEIYTDLDRLSLAADAQNKELRIYMENFGEEDPRTMHCMGKLSDTLLDDKRYTEAEHFALQAFELRKRASGPDHADTLFNMYNLALIWHAMGRYDEAIQLLEDYIHIQRNIRGKESTTNSETWQMLLESWKARQVSSQPQNARRGKSRSGGQ
ncbi:hypothetical protein QC763_303270 [Podospora pseudopauciseta]|uniref:C2H2-type domain-containing protein n=1 Tax=Podospora pseudopauciseta TaxID=2093780 RepID=A0ABR0HFP5_9PEZI|nr:hypothetical protein QC763_303270 [Podospora pseudopauciseta]